MTTRITAAGMHDDSQPPAEVSARPEGVPDKFWNAETGEVNQQALLESHNYLEKKAGGIAESATDPVSEPTVEPAAEGEVDLTIQPPSAGPAAELFTADKMQEYATTMAESGALSEAQLETFTALGLPAEVVEKIGQAFMTDAAKFEGDIIAEVGGREAFGEVAEWYGANATDAELSAYNAAVSGKDKAAAMLATKGMMASYQKANGRTPAHKVNAGGATPTSSVQPFTSWKELSLAQGTKEYKTNPAVRDQVAARLRASNLS